MDNATRIARELVAAVADGREPSDEYLMLDTYADAGHPPSVHLLAAVRQAARPLAAAAGIASPVRGVSVGDVEFLVLAETL